MCVCVFELMNASLYVYVYKESCIEYQLTRMLIKKGESVRNIHVLLYLGMCKFKDESIGSIRPLEVAKFSQS